MEARFSRLAASIQSLGGIRPGAARIIELPVLLTGEASILATPNGQKCFLDAFRLLVRMTKHLSVFTDGQKELEGQVRILAESVTRSTIHFLETSDARPEHFAAILNIGCQVRPKYPWTTINSNGFLARVSSKSRISSECSQINPIGALAAASLGVTEIFKRLVPVNLDRGPIHDALNFSFYTYSESDWAGPELPIALNIGTLLQVGAGAIGNGIVHLLSQLGLNGRVVIVDRQDFADENLGTCLLIGPSDINQPKAVTLANFIPGAVGYKEEVESSIKSRVGIDFEIPAIVVNGLDDIGARRSVQVIWPDLVIDGAIGAFSCEATLHPWGPDLSCLLCDFEEPTRDVLAESSVLTGLSREKLHNPLDVVTEEDIQAAPEEKRDYLRRFLGKTYCSVVSEAEMGRVSAGKTNFAASVPFVACLSACMVVGELVRAVSQWPPELETGFQFDVLVGPQRGIRKSHSRKLQCICLTRQSIIDGMRKERRPRI
jgi:hypothetical protein